MNERAVRILNVNDRDIPRYVHEQTLRREGYEVVSVANGVDALAAARNDIDVVLLDVQLPDMDGFEVCRRLKSDPVTSTVIVLMTSAAFTTTKNKVDGLNAGADGYLTQPYEAVEFSATLHALLRTRSAERRAIQLAIELRGALDVRDEFLSMFAHELRNPIAAISMALTMLELAAGDALKEASYRGVAQRQIANLVRLVEDLLDASRITRGAVDLRSEKVDLASVVQSAIVATRPGIEARGHELSVTVMPGNFFLNGDGARLEQVLMNLLSNASRNTQPGGTLSVQLAPEVVNGVTQAILRVRDTGPGIPDDMLYKVFDLFVQVAPTIDRSAGGLGMGLTMVKRLVEMHGGSVSAHNGGAGKGCEFVVRLPLTLDIQAPATPPFVDTAPPAVQTGKRRIVIIEDSDDARDMLKAFLEQLGHEVAVAKDGLDGAALLLKLCPDVALVDIGLPGIDGYEVARRVRAESNGETVYLVALTGYGGTDAKAKAKAAGFDLHITKPFDIDALPEVVSRSRAAGQHTRQQPYTITENAM